MKYEIFNDVGGVSLGVYEGDGPHAALDAMARDAGCKDYKEACEITSDGRPAPYAENLFLVDEDGNKIVVDELYAYNHGKA